MQEFIVDIRETYSTMVSVVANDEREAIAIASARAFGNQPTFRTLDAVSIEIVAS